MVITLHIDYPNYTQEMRFTNNYKSPSKAELDVSKLLDPSIEYDVNSSIPVPESLESERVQIVPYVPSQHAKLFYNGLAAHPDLTRYLPLDFPTFESWVEAHESFIRQDPTSTLFVIIDKTKTPAPSSLEAERIPNGRMAGVIGWLHGYAANLNLEIGPVIIFPEFQKTFVSANAIGLLLKYALDLPSQGGLGYRRVAWQASPLNEPSIKAAEKMGFVKEGILRWTWVLAEGRKGREVKGEERGKGDGRDSIYLSLCWDDWEGGAREKVLKRMERV